MDGDTRRRMTTGVRVADLVLEEARLAREENRAHGLAQMTRAAHECGARLRDMVADYHKRQRRRAGYR
jgi:hypothetical protein